MRPILEKPISKGSNSIKMRPIFEKPISNGSNSIKMRLILKTTHIKGAKFDKNEARPQI